MCKVILTGQSMQSKIRKGILPSLCTAQNKNLGFKSFNLRIPTK